MRRASPSASPRHKRGFTLVEVMVALAIVAIALAAGARASGALLHNAQRQSDTLVAQLCAENELVRIRLAAQLPPIGETSFSCEQGGVSLDGTLAVTATPNPNFRRVDAHVDTDVGSGASITTVSLLTISTVVGRL